ncbi:hypothetical protein D3C71_1622460 [compost metagenome]
MIDVFPASLQCFFTPYSGEQHQLDGFCCNLVLFRAEDCPQPLGLIDAEEALRLVVLGVHANTCRRVGVEVAP